VSSNVPSIWFETKSIGTPKEMLVAIQSTKEATSPAATVQPYIEAFNSLDEAKMADCFAEAGHILDGMAPHVWSGRRATLDWRNAVLAEADHLGLSDFHMTLGAALHDDVTDDAAYFVAPATLKFNVRGQPITQSGAIFTLALQRVEDRWLIAAWAWSKGAGGGTGDVNRPSQQAGD
jgi:hypothetical protein